MTGLAEAAIAYATGGALLLPLHTPADNAAGCSCSRRGCEHRGKHPRTLNGLADATADVDKVTEWWSMWPEANIGIRPHPGHVVIDVDDRSGGHVQLEAMQDRHGVLPPTRTAATGGGGLHVWFRLDGEVRGKLAPGIDVKSHTGYLVAPPSLHESGRRYRWINTGGIVDAPDYLRPLLVRPPLKGSEGTGTLTPAALAGLVGKVAHAPVGERNSLLFWACARAAEKGGDPNPLVDAAVQNGLTRREAEATAQSAFRAVCKGAA